MSEMLSFILGLFVGLCTNLVSWWILSRYIVPKVEFSPSIAKIESAINEHDSSGVRYRFKFQNAGRRGIIDVELEATLRIEKLQQRDSVQVIPLALSAEGEKKAHIICLQPVKPENKAARVWSFYINSVEQFRTNTVFPDEFRKKATARMLKLEDVLSLGERAWIQVSIFGYDEFSGARKLFLSKDYTGTDIKEGPFAIGSLEVAVIKI